MGDRIGQRLGQYALTGLLGQGGFAEVYLGEHVYLKTPAAIKVLHNRLTDSDELTTFLEEARMVAHLNHIHIVRVLDFGVDGEIPFLVMDYAPGGTLRQRHKRGERLPLDTVTQYIKQLADALQYAHDEKVIHRDVKPENMLVGPRQEIVLSDFGIALVVQSSRYQSTQDVVGTVAYMAPEQIQGKPRPASDQYSLGITVYEWLCGVRPFSGSFTELCTQHLFAPVPPLREKTPMLSPEVEQVVMRALAKDPKERFGSVQAFAVAFEKAHQVASSQISTPISLRPPHSSSSRQEVPDVEAASSAQPSAMPAAPDRSSPTISDTAVASERGISTQDALLPTQKPLTKNPGQKKGWSVNAILIASAVILVGASLAGFFAWNSGNNTTPVASHVTTLTTAYHSIIRRKPDIEYNMQNLSPGQKQDWSGNLGCTFVPQGYLVSDTPDPNGRGTLSGECLDNSSYDEASVMAQVTMSIQNGTCGALAIGDWIWAATLCADGKTDLCMADGLCAETTTNVIHQGLHKDNILAIEIVVIANNQFECISFINGQYALEQATDHIYFGHKVILRTDAIAEPSPALNSVLYKDVKWWRLANPVYY